MKLHLATLGAVLVLTSAASGQNSGWRNKQAVDALAKRIDVLIADAQAKAGVKPLPPADPSAFFRRFHLDLVGRIPTLIDMRDYLDNEDSQKLWDWSERFLTEPSYGRHFASVFRDHILTGANQQGQAFAPPLEGWLRERLDRDRGYHRIVHEILSPNAETMNAGMSPAAFYIGAESKPENLAGAASRVFLGVKLECAQCHAHPFASWTRDQFWEFAAFFAGIQDNRALRRGLVGVQPVNLNVREITIPGTEKVVKAKFLTGDEPPWKAGVATRTILADWVTSPENPYFAKATVDFVWSYFFGISLLEPILEPSDDSPVTHEELLNHLAQEFIAQDFDVKFLIRAIVHTQAYARSSAGPAPVGRDDYVLFIRMPVRGLSPEQLYDSFVEATVGPRGHSEPSYAPNQQFAALRSADPRAEFLAKFASTERRHESQTSILQALYMMNGRAISEKLRNNSEVGTIATRTLSTEERLHTLFLMTLSRPPRPAELSRLSRYVAEGGNAEQRSRLEDVLWALLNSAEFRLNH